MVMMTMTMRNSTQKQEDFVKKRKSSEGEKKLPFLLTRFIRKENLDKRGCKITEIVEREKKIKADPIFWDQFISGMNCVVFLFCS